jgi:hypothetical protein
LPNRPNTRHDYQRVIERWIRDERIGHRLVKQMRREHVDRMSHPGAANDLLKKPHRRQVRHR